MNETDLRRWVRGELPPEERRAVSRWIVLCTDPRLGPFLQGLAIEASEERADAALVARGGVWGRLNRAWRELLDAGLAQLSAGATPAVILAEGTEEAPGPDLRLSERDGGLVVSLRTPVSPDPALATLFLSDDDGQIQALPTRREGREIFAALPANLGPRPTIWAALSAVPDGLEPAAALARARGRAWHRAGPSDAGRLTRLGNFSRTIAVRETGHRQHGGACGQTR